MAKQINVLSIDGGGVRGIVPAMFLASIEQRTGLPVAELFDLVAGTSTGGIVALGLAKPGPDGAPHYSARSLVQLYQNEARNIFSRSFWYELHALGNIVNEKYPATGLEMVLETYFGDAMLSDALVPTIVTSYEIEQRFPFFFKSAKAKVLPNYDFPMRLIARAATAAPTYFEPLKLPSLDPEGYYALIDGGVYANNPAMCAYVEAVTMFPDAERVLVVSLGTGELTRPLSYERAKGWGLVQWAQPILDVVFDGVSDTVDYQLQQVLPARNGARHYYRFQVSLSEGNQALDNASDENLHALTLLAENAIRAQDDALDQLCGQLVSRA